jgi:putative ABC transport system permease protein
MKTLLLRAAGLPGEAILALLRLAALLLAPTRAGRLLRTVSVPRFREHRLRTTLTVLGIALGIAVLVAVLLVNGSIARSFAATIDDISGKVDFEVTSPSGLFDEAAFEQARAVAGVKKAAPVLQETVPMRLPGAKGERLLVLGVDFIDGDDEYFRPYDSRELPAIKHDPLEFLNSRTNILVSRRLAERFHLKLHDKIPLVTASGVQEFDIWGFIEARAGGVGRAFGGAVAVMYYQAMQVAFDHGSNIHRVDLALAPGADAAEVKARLLATLGPSFEVGRPERRQDRVVKMMAGLRGGLTMASLIALLVGMFLVYNTMSITVVQRRREISILRALGTTRRQMLFLFALEGTLIGAVGSALGLAIGVGLARAALDTMSRMVSEAYLEAATSSLDLAPATFAGCFIAGVLAVLASSLAPARQAAHAKPAAALRPAAAALTAARRGLLLRTDVPAAALLLASPLLLGVGPVRGVPMGGFGACLALVLGAALFAPRAVIGARVLLRALISRALGVAGRIAAENLTRDLSRVAVTAGALMVGVALATSMGAFIGSFTSSMVSWIDQSIPADLFITSAGRITGLKNVPMVDALSGELGAIPGVALVERVRMVEIDFRGDTVKLGSTDGEIYVQRGKPSFIEGDYESAMAAFRRGEAIVSENFASKFGVHTGDSIDLATRGGVRRFPVAGVIVDYGSDLGTIFLERAAYVSAWRDDRVDTYRLYLTAEASRTEKERTANLERVRREVYDRFGARYELVVLTNREFKGEVLSLLEQVFGIMRALEVVAILIAALGVVNALFASVLDRTREVGVLRAIGMRRREVRRMVMAEAGLLGAAGAASGLAAGLGLGYILVAHLNALQSGWHFPFRPPWGSIAEMAALVVLVSVLAGWYPAREAARMAVSEALEYE